MQTFILEGDKLTSTDVVKHFIKTPRCIKSINIRPYRLPWAYQKKIERQLTYMKDSKIIRDCFSSFYFLLVVVKKINLKLRVNINYEYACI